jgi:Skp family chaperone for outer membrane proteins
MHRRPAIALTLVLAALVAAASLPAAGSAAPWPAGSVDLAKVRRDEARGRKLDREMLAEVAKLKGIVGGGAGDARAVDDKILGELRTRTRLDHDLSALVAAAAPSPAQSHSQDEIDPILAGSVGQHAARMAELTAKAEAAARQFREAAAGETESQKREREQAGRVAAMNSLMHSILSVDTSLGQLLP